MLVTIAVPLAYAGEPACAANHQIESKNALRWRRADHPHRTLRKAVSSVIRRRFLAPLPDERKPAIAAAGRNA
jgi:hypothetical protein